MLFSFPVALASGTAGSLSHTALLTHPRTRTRTSLPSLRLFNPTTTTLFTPCLTKKRNIRLSDKRAPFCQSPRDFKFETLPTDVSGSLSLCYAIADRFHSPGSSFVWHSGRQDACVAPLCKSVLGHWESAVDGCCIHKGKSRTRKRGATGEREGVRNLTSVVCHPRPRGRADCGRWILSLRGRREVKRASCAPTLNEKDDQSAGGKTRQG